MLGANPRFAHTRNIDHAKFVNMRDMKGGRVMLVDISSEVEIINGLWSCRAAARTVRWGKRRASVIEGSESALKRKGR